MLDDAASKSPVASPTTDDTLEKEERGLLVTKLDHEFELDDREFFCCGPPVKLSSAAVTSLRYSGYDAHTYKRMDALPK
jgi:ferredoxin-NADP reductase